MEEPRCVVRNTQTGEQCAAQPVARYQVGFVDGAIVYLCEQHAAAIAQSAVLSPA